MPYNHLEPLSQEQKKDVKTYCINDVDLTADLFKYLHKELAVRELLNKEYNVDSRSKSDAQIAELLFEKKVASSGKKVKSFDFKYVAPEYINFKTDILKRFTDIEFKGIIGDEILKEGVIEDVVINGTEYSCGIGGLHSKENKRFIKASDDEYLIDVDVVSYYPTIILNNGYCPEYYIKEDFLKFYQKIYHDRVIAKKEGDKDKSEVYKIILNGSFGKFGDKFSKLYSPKLLIHTTITGQLSVLMLIEKLEEYGYKVISSNTDGIAVIVKKNKYDFFKKIVKSWEDKVKFTTEEVRYSALYNHSVNSYIAVKEDGSLKLKGTFAESAINKNINAPICKKAVINYITRDIAIEDTILKTKHNPLDLIKMRKVKNGGYWKGEYLGKIVRWYWSTKGEPITNPKGDKVAGTDDAFPIMDMGDGIKDLHYDRYIKESYKLLSWIGIKI